MTDEYTPSTSVVRNNYASSQNMTDIGVPVEEAWAAFDRWLASVKAEVWDEVKAEIRSIPHWYSADDEYGEFDLVPLGPDETSEHGAFMEVMRVLNANPYRRGVQ